MGKVIIDGVDVSECDRLRTYRDWTYSSDKWCGISNDGGCECEQNPNCYYKQLQRLKKENERLKEELRTERIHSSQIEELEESLQHAKAENEKLIDQNFKIAQKYTKLEQENERLKARLRPLEDSYFNGLSSMQIAELTKKSIRITAENRKLEYALQEIRDIAKEQLQDVSDRCIDTTPMYSVHRQIIAKINEVMGEK